MEGFKCDLCGTGPFSFQRALSTHKVTCLGNIRDLQEQHHDSRPPLNATNIAESSEFIELHENVVTNERPLVSDFQQSNELLGFDLEGLLDDDFEFDDFPKYSQILSTNYDSTFSLINWIRTYKKGGGLSNKDIEKLFREVLLHPSFKLEDVSVRSAHDVQKWEKTLHSKDDGWKKIEIDGHVLNYHNPIIALESLFSSPAVAKNFIFKPSMIENQEPRIYSTPATGNWWHSMQVCT